MPASSLKHLAWLALLTPVAGVSGAARTPAEQPITLDAASADYDMANNNLVFRKVRIAEGSMSISADVGHGQAQAGGAKRTATPNFDDSLWTFRGNVKITVEQGQLTADDAEINFFRQHLSKAVANGKPAAFDERDDKAGKIAHGRADTIDYSAAKGIVQLLANAWLSNGDTEIRGDSLQYNVLDRVIVAEGAEQNSQRVHIVITPPAAKP